MTDAREAVEAALYRVRVARPTARRERMCELMTAGVQLCDEAAALHEWLVRAWDWLDVNPNHDDFVKREDRLLEEIQRYQAMHDSLGRALTLIGEDAPACPLTTAPITRTGNPLAVKSETKPEAAANSALSPMGQLELGIAPETDTMQRRSMA